MISDIKWDEQTAKFVWGQEALTASIKVSGELGGDEQRCGGPVGHQALLRTGGQLHQTLDKTADLCDVRAEVCVSVAWPGGGLRRGHT